MQTLVYEVVSKVGKREHNEDSYLVTPEGCCYIVCDGVGGNAKGEVASNLCCQSFADFFKQRNTGFPDEDAIRKALLYTEKCFSIYLCDNPEATGMGTTLALLSVEQNRAIIAHAGDSRVYHIRDGKILYVTPDHSVVAELVASGHLKPEQALHHPRKNQILRAVQGSEQPTEADVFRIDDVQPGDYFLLCTDGVLESVSETFIQDHFKVPHPVKSIIDDIREICLQHSSDNYTAIAVQAVASASSLENDRQPGFSVNQTGNPSKKANAAVLGRKNKIIALFAIILIGMVGYFYFSKRPEEQRAKVRGSKDVVINNTPPVENKAPEQSTGKSTVQPIHVFVKQSRDSSTNATPASIPNRLRFREREFVYLRQQHLRPKKDSATAVPPATIGREQPGEDKKEKVEQKIIKDTTKMSPDTTRPTNNQPVPRAGSGHR